MKQALEQLRAGEIDFARFMRETEKRWQSLARYLIKRWRPPSTVTEDDVVQELVMGAWEHVGKFDPSYGKAIDKYVVWNACTKAKRFLHRQRSAHKRSDRSESRNHVLMSQLARPGQDENQLIERMLASDGDRSIEADVECAERIGQLEPEHCFVAVVRLLPPRRRRSPVERRLESASMRCRIRRRRHKRRAGHGS